jgi:hypothetical protein
MMLLNVNAVGMDVAVVGLKLLELNLTWLWG